MARLWISDTELSKITRPMTPVRESHAYNRFFFFSSRRRHTRLQGDWSSDVCSSDLAVSNRRSSFIARRPSGGWQPKVRIVPQGRNAAWLLWSAAPSVLYSSTASRHPVGIPRGCGSGDCARRANKEERRREKGTRVRSGRFHRESPGEPPQP